MSLFTFVCLMYQQYNYTFHELRMQLENQVVQIQIQYHKAFQIIWEAFLRGCDFKVTLTNVYEAVFQTPRYRKYKIFLKGNYYGKQITDISLEVVFFINMC